MSAQSPTKASAAPLAGERGAATRRPAREQGTAFDAQTRQALGPDGLLPPTVEMLDQQAARAYDKYGRLSNRPTRRT
jgi:hypothetical protein